MRFVEYAFGAVANGYPWSIRSGLQALNNDLPPKKKKKKLFLLLGCEFQSFAAPDSGIQSGS